MDDQVTTTELVVAEEQAAPAIPVASELSILDHDEIEQVQALLNVMDVNPRLPGMPEYKGAAAATLNIDFAVIEGTIEITRNFGLKARKKFALPWTVKEVQFASDVRGGTYTVIGSCDGVDGVGAAR